MEAWSDLSVFLAAIRGGSASRAAATLGMTVTTVTRRLTRLEEAVGRPLFVRTADGLEPTAAGLALLPHAEKVEQGALAGLAAVQALEERPAGRVEIALPGDMVQLILLPDVRQLLQAHPELEIVISAGTGLADLMRREADIAVRVVRPEEGEELVSTRLRDVDNAVFANEGYLRTIANPRDPDQHRWISWDTGLGHLPEAQWLARACREPPRVVVRTNHAATVRLSAAAGCGAAVLPRLFGQLTPTLTEVALDAPPPPTVALWMVTHRALRWSPRVAAVWEYLDERLRARADRDDLPLLRAELQDAYGLRFGT